MSGCHGQSLTARRLQDQRNSALSTHLREIDVGSLAYGLSRPVSMTMEGIRDERPSVSEITISKANDSASLPLIRAALTDPRVGTARITFVKTEMDKALDYFVIEMLDARVTSVVTSSDGDRPAEHVTLVSHGSGGLINLRE